MTITTTDAVEVSDDIAAITARLVDLVNASNTIGEEIAELKRRLRAATPVGHRAVFHGEPLYTLQPNRRFDVDLAVQLLTPAQVTACQVITVDPKKVKAQLPPVLLEQCMVDQGEPKVVLA